MEQEKQYSKIDKLIYAIHKLEETADSDERRKELSEIKIKLVQEKQKDLNINNVIEKSTEE